jgi:hypothetical protein
LIKDGFQVNQVINQTGQGIDRYQIQLINAGSESPALSMLPDASLSLSISPSSIEKMKIGSQRRR